MGDSFDIVHKDVSKHPLANAATTFEPATLPLIHKEEAEHPDMIARAAEEQTAVTRDVNMQEVTHIAGIEKQTTGFGNDLSSNDREDRFQATGAMFADGTIQMDDINKYQGPSEFVCEWDDCQTDCGSQKELVLHVNAHVAELPWVSK